MGFFSFIFGKEKPEKVEVSTMVDTISSPVENEKNVENPVREIPWIKNYQNYDEYLEAYRLYLESGPRASKVEIEGSRFKLYRDDGSSWYEDLPPRPAIDKREPFCPNCGEFLDKIPERKKKCQHCSKYIYSYSTESSPGIWEKRLRGEDEGKVHNDSIKEEKEKFSEYVRSGGYLKDTLDEISQNDLIDTIIVSGGGCEHCQGERTMTISKAYKIAPICKYCGYGYTVTGRITHI